MKRRAFLATVLGAATVHQFRSLLPATTALQPVVLDDWVEIPFKCGGVIANRHPVPVWLGSEAVLPLKRTETGELGF